MSLFDVIRYHISDLPTADELESLPIELYTQWYNVICPQLGDIISPARYSVFMSIWQPKTVEQEVTLLRKMIAEYEPL